MSNYKSQPESARSSDSEGSSSSKGTSGSNGSSNSLSDKETSMISELFIGRNADNYVPMSLRKGTGTKRPPFKVGGKKSRRKPKKKKRTIRRRTRQ